MQERKKTAVVFVAALVAAVTLASGGTADARGFGRAAGYDLGAGEAGFAAGASAAGADGPFGYGYGYGHPYAYEPYAGGAYSSALPPHAVYFGYPYGAANGYGLSGY